MSHGAELSEQNEALRRENAELYAQIKALGQRLAQGSAGPGYSLELVAGLRTLEAPMSVMADSYKAGHFLMYPECLQMTAYGEFREPMKGMTTGGVQDNRFVFYGMRHYIDNFVSRKWTKADIDAADAFYKTHAAGGKPYPFPRDLFNAMVEENDGYFPVVIEALPEGSVAYIHTPVFIITAEDKYSRLATFLETLLTMVWYPSCVATLSRYTRDAIEDGFNQSVDDENKWLLPSRLHDFGFRGCTSVEQSVLGGCAHLLSFEGSDTMSACYHAQFHLNGGRPIASSIPATEHSVMTAWPTEEDAINNEIEHFGNGLFAAVMDSYDYDNALDVVLPKVTKERTQTHHTNTDTNTKLIPIPRNKCTRARSRALVLSLSLSLAHSHIHRHTHTYTHAHTRTHTHQVAPNCKAKGGVMVIRPDSGDPVTQVISKTQKCSVHLFVTHVIG